MIAVSRGYENSPGEAEIKAFDAFICELSFALGMLETGKTVAAVRPRTGPVNALLPSHAGRLPELIFGKTVMCIDDARAASGAAYAQRFVQPALSH